MVYMDKSFIRNFCIIAHIDHGKSTLADRLMQITGTVESRDLTEQHLDTMDLERERGITIKAQAVRLSYTAKDGNQYELNLIDTPGHVDFTYEVSRSLAACEGVLLLVDAAQGIQAQTMANVYLAMEHDLAIIPVINKLDLPAAEPERVSTEIEQSFGFQESDIYRVSAKTGEGVADLLEAIVKQVEPPRGEPEAPLRALIFDSRYDSYKGVVAYVRVVDGELKADEPAQLMGTGVTADILETGYFSPSPQKSGGLSTGQVGYTATGLKNVRDCRVGDTLTARRRPATAPLDGYRPLKSMVFSGLYPSDGESYPELRDALEKLQLNDPALVFEPESSAALGFGFRCGFLGLLHMDVIQERLEREYDQNLIATAPSVNYQVTLTDNSEAEVDNPSRMPPAQNISDVREPWVEISIIAPSRYIGPIMELVTGRRGEFQNMEYLQASASAIGSDGPSEAHARDARVHLEYEAPLSEILVDFHDQLKARTQGYASMDYSLIDYRSAELVKLDVMVNQAPVDALSLITHRGEALPQGRKLARKLKELIPRQMFEVPIQAAIGNRVIARETVKALRKNVLAKCYGGDVTRKRKLLEQQAEGKKRLKKIGKVEVPQEAFMAVLRLDRE